MKATIHPQYLRSEYRQNPIGIDTLHPRLSWELAASKPNQVQAAYQILVADRPDALTTGQANMWDSGKVETAQCNQVVYKGQPLLSAQQYWWTVRVWDHAGQVSDYSTAASWQMGLLDQKDWRASWIGLEVTATHDPVMKPSLYMRRSFSSAIQVHKAVLFATARGCYRALLNGHPVGDDVLNPGWTDYPQRTQYRTYDVTHLIKQGPNVIAAVVADGWYAGYVGQNSMRNHYGQAPELLMQLHIEYETGEKTILVTDAAWKAATGPICYSDLLMGEYYDARLEMPSWGEPDFDDSAWQPVHVNDRDETPLVAQVDQPIRVTRHLQPIKITQPKAGIHIFDLGQNMVGWVRLTVKGEAGTKIQLRHSEVLNPDGTLYTENLREAKQTNTYILNGNGTETYEPSFTFHGFRYVEVTGLPETPTPASITGCVIHNDLPDTGTFDCSNPMVNQLWKNILWGQRGNFVSIPTDCPQRNERLGWTGDAQVFFRTASFNMDVASFFSKWMVDLVDGQSSVGGFPDFAPRIAMKLDVGPDAVDWDGAPAWGDAGIIIPHRLHQTYGDVRIIKRHYEAMTRWMAYIADANPDYLRKHRCNHNFGDWLSLGTETPKTLVATAYWYYCTQLMSQMAASIGKDDDAQVYRDLGQNIRKSFISEYVSPDGSVAGGTQTGYVLALHFGLIPDELRSSAITRLLKTVADNDWHLATGFLGTPLICPVLTETGHVDAAYRLLLNETYPSWGYMIKQGATTMWERWDGWTDENGFQDPDMNSFNHYAYGAIGEWLYRYVAGIDLDESMSDYHGYKRVRIRPYPDGRLSYAHATYRSIYGPISSHWWFEGDQFHLQVSIPANITARIYVPATDVRQMRDSDETTTTDLKAVDTTGEYTVFEGGSGDYHFVGKRE
jgi:alpha-L-rhamnosidase